MRVRVRFTKLGKIRFLGHRDLARCWERAIRRAGLQMAYSEGFSPRPKIHYGLALSTGCESRAEYIDLDLIVPADLATLTSDLGDGLPTGVEITGVAEIPANSEALQAIVGSCTWEFELVGLEDEGGGDGDGDGASTSPPADLAGTARGAVSALLARDEVLLTFERKGKPVTENIRPALLAASVDPDLRGEAVVLTVELATKPRSIRPTEFLACLEPAFSVRRICRIEQWMTIDGETGPLMAPSDPSWPVAARLAS